MKHLISAILLSWGFLSMGQSYELTRKISLTEDSLAKGDYYRFERLFFEYSKNTIRPESIEELDSAAAFCLAHPTAKIEVGAHMDERGADRYCMKLTQRRSQAVVEYFIEKGCSSDQLIAQGYGEAMPLVPNTSDENRQKNRRVELRILEIK